MDEIKAIEKEAVQDVADFPQPGIVFKDLTPLWASPELSRRVHALLAKKVEGVEFDKILAIESRGFILGAFLAQTFSKGLILARKAGKLPRSTHQQSYSLEYGEDQLEVHQGDLGEGSRVLIVDDILATGGTAVAASQLVQKEGAQAVGALFYAQIQTLGGASHLPCPSFYLWDFSSKNGNH